MKHKGTKRLETQRLILRKFTAEDAPAAFRNWTSDEKVTKYLRWPTHRDLETTRSIIEEWVESSENVDFYQWAIELKELREPIGTISVVEQNDRLALFHIGYCIGSKWWHRGIVSEAFLAVISFLFEEVGANRIESQHDPENIFSGKVMEKCGLIYEGRLRQADYNNQGIVDACVYGLLKDDWKQM